MKGFSQPGSTVALDKPKQYENRTLASEKTGQKKFTFTKRLFQNNFTHYNYYFNAYNRLNDILVQAKESFRDDFTKLLPFYNYSLDVTSQNTDIDTVIYKCNAGILLHDLRNDWVDNMYLLLGQAYFYRKQFDSASQVFQYINYAFAPKEEGGYDIPVGSNISNTQGIFSVATKEKDAFPKSVVTEPPSRNDALLWQARTYTETSNFGEAAGILEILRHDPNFPVRLAQPLHDILAYWYYKQEVYDSAAQHLTKALDASASRLEKARREFLIAQMYEKSHNVQEAIKWYAKSAETTTDPIMAVYANLNSIKISGDSSKNIVEDKLKNLLKMAHRDKYTGNRDIIYYAIAQVELEKNDPNAAVEMLKKSIHYNTEENPSQKSKSFLLLADVTYDLNQYIPAKNYYDSVDVSFLTEDSDKLRLADRQPALAVIAQGLVTIKNEDSLQTVAAMPKDARDAYVRRLVRTLRRQQGLKEDEININPAVQQAASDLFNQNTAISGNSSADWYFNNFSLKSSGYNEFIAKWGRRPNTDNWQRLAALNQAISQQETQSDSTAAGGMENAAGVNGAAADDLTFESLYANLPLTAEQMEASKEKISTALFLNGKTFQGKLGDYAAAISVYEELLDQYPDSAHVEEALFNLYYCYNQVGRKSAADSTRDVLKRRFPSGSFTAKLSQRPIDQTQSTDPATLKYKEIYNLFMEGNFDAARNEKKKADSIYGNSYWTPQLLYIEAIYYVSKREDSVAIDRLTQLKNLYASSPLAEKATTMIDVLKRRNQIENYLTNLKIERYKEDETPVVDLTPVQPTIKKVQVQSDSVVTSPVTQKVTNLVDTTAKAAPTVLSYQFNPTDRQFVYILLDKVAPVYAAEAKNAFNRFNDITFYNQEPATSSAKLDDRYDIVLIGPFDNALAAVNYVDKTKPQTAGRILPWLTTDKYSFGIISESNLEIMKQTKDVDSYKKLLDKALPGKF